MFCSEQKCKQLRGEEKVGSRTNVPENDFFFSVSILLSFLPRSKFLMNVYKLNIKCSFALTKRIFFELNQNRQKSNKVSKIIL